jgi:hypothetical protein
MVALFLALALLMDAGKRPAVRELDFSIIEVNHRHDENWRHCYDQVILWDWNPEYRRFDVEAWFLIDQVTGVSIRRSGDCWLMRKTFGTEVFVIRARTKVETWTSFDPESKNKELKNEKFRRGLR